MEGNGLTKKIAGTNTLRLGIALSLLLVLPVMHAAASAGTELASPNSQASGFFGYSVAISGATVVVGAYNEAVGTAAGAGHAYVFDAISGGLVSTLISPNPQYLGSFGFSVAVSGTTVVVGAFGEAVGTAQLAGHAYVFDATTGGLISTLISPNPEAYGQFGNSVAISGTTVVVGAPNETVGTAAGAGHAYLFDATTGGLVRTLTSPNPQAGFFGFSVAISGTKVVVGAPVETVGTAASAGHAYVFSILRTTSTSVSCSPNKIQNYHSTTCTATVIDTSPGTPITPTGTVAWSNSGPGTFSSTTCTLSGTGGTATCNVTFTSLPGKPSVETITGTYGGDADHSGSSASTTITHK